MTLALGSLLVVLLGLGGLLLGRADSEAATASAVLSGFWFLLSGSAGCLAWAMVLNLCGGRWVLPLRRLWECAWPLWLPTWLFALAGVLLLEQLFPWAGAGGEADPSLRHLLEHRAAWNGPLALIVRTVVILAAGLLAAWWLFRSPRDEQGTRRKRRLAAIGLPLLVLAMGVASIDWLFATSPHFHSTVLSLVQLLAGVQVAHGVAAALAWWAWRHHGLQLGTGQWYALGTLLLALSCLWAYLHFSQIIVIVMGDLPHASAWWLQHSSGAWGWLGIAIGVLRFALPFLLLLTRRQRERPVLIALLGLLLLPAHATEALWWVAPSTWSHPGSPGWRDAVALLTALAAAVGVSALIARSGRWRSATDEALTTALQHHPAGAGA